MDKILRIFTFLFLSLAFGCSISNKQAMIQDINGLHQVAPHQIWLTHEHILVDFIGADSIKATRWNDDSVIKEMLPYLEELKKYKVNYFVDATPIFLGRDVKLLEELNKKTGIRIITNTGLYGARNDKFIPKYAKEASAENLAEMWIEEFRNGIDGTSIKPGFIKIGIDNADTLSIMHQKLVKAAAIAHLKTGLTIASHTGEAAGLWPQLKILKEMGVSPEAFIWVHAQGENNQENYLKAAKTGCWMSLDGMGWEIDNHLEKILFAKTNGFLDRILISHDAGWYDPQKQVQDIKPFTDIFTKLYPMLKSKGFTDAEYNLLISENPAKAFAVRVRKIVAN